MLSLLRKVQPFLTVAIVAVVAYDGWVFYSRWSSTRALERARQEREAEAARHTLDKMGGEQFRILNFYASPAAIPRGGRAKICYGVYGAKTVRIEPPVGEVRPALAHCLVVSPATSTEYKLVAEDNTGQTARQELVIQVGR